MILFLFLFDAVDGREREGESENSGLDGRIISVDFNFFPFEEHGFVHMLYVCVSGLLLIYLFIVCI